MHYHVYTGPRIDSGPKDVFNFKSSQQAIDKVMELIEKFGASFELVEVTHTENESGRFSTIIIPHVDYKIVLHECQCLDRGANFTLAPLDKNKLN